MTFVYVPYSLDTVISEQPNVYERLPPTDAPVSCDRIGRIVTLGVQARGRREAVHRLKAPSTNGPPPSEIATTSNV